MTKVVVVYGEKGKITEQHLCFDQIQHMDKVKELKRLGMKVTQFIFAEPAWNFMSIKQQGVYLEKKVPWPGDSDVKK
jgi:hypothetical protein